MVIKLRFLGHAAFEITTEKGRKVMIDPFISKNSMCPIKVMDVKKCDFVLVTHAAHDHLGDAIEIIKNTGALLLCGHDIRIHALRKGVPKDRIKVAIWGVSLERAGIKIKTVESRHCSFLESDGLYLSAQPNGFIIYTESDDRIYHPGDTSIFTDLRLIGELYRPNIALLPVGALKGYLTELTPYEAALAVQWLGPEIAIPMHYEAESKAPEQFSEFVRSTAPWAKVVIMKPGEIFEYNKR